MDNIRIKNAALKIRGSVERSVGKLTGNKKLEAQGHINHAAGSVRTTTGNAQDAAIVAVKHRTKSDCCPGSK